MVMVMVIATPSLLCIRSHLEQERRWKSYWTLDAIWELLYLGVLVAICFLLRPNNNNQRYTIRHYRMPYDMIRYDTKRYDTIQRNAITNSLLEFMNLMVRVVVVAVVGIHFKMNLRRWLDWWC